MTSPDRQVVILAGGLGTRLGMGIPETMVEIGGRPNLEHQILLAKEHGFTNVLLLVSHLGQYIEEYFGNGKRKRLGIRIAYSYEDPPLGTAGALRHASKLLHDRFLLLYGDVFIDCNLTNVWLEHNERNPTATIVVHPNDHPYDSDLVEADEDGWVTAIHTKHRHPDLWVPNNVNAGAIVLERSILSAIPPDRHLDLASRILPMLLVRQGPRFLHVRMRAYRTSEYFKDFGTHDRLSHVRHDLESGKIAALRGPRPAVFLDRDGVINKEVDHLPDPDQFELIPGVGDAIRRLNQAGYLVIVITNQPVIARGECSVQTLRLIHNKMETLLGREGAWVDAIYYCPHHPDRGFPGEVPKLKIACECRKPKTGLFEQAMREWKIAPDSYVIGDSHRDLLPARQFGFRPIGVNTGHGCRDCVGEYRLVEDLQKAVEFILK